MAAEAGSTHFDLNDSCWLCAVVHMLSATNIKADVTQSQTCLMNCREEKIASLSDSMKLAQDDVQLATERHTSLMDQLQVINVVSLLVAQWLAPQRSTQPLVSAAMCQDVTQQVTGSSLRGNMLISQASVSGSGQRFSTSQLRLWHSPCQRTPLGCN